MTRAHVSHVGGGSSSAVFQRRGHQPARTAHCPRLDRRPDGSFVLREHSLPKKEIRRLVSYDVTKSNGVNVGLNPLQTVSPQDAKCPDSNFPCREYVWYAGSLNVRPDGTTSHYDVIIPRAGGANGVAGDYLYRSWTANQYQVGMWGLFRVAPVERGGLSSLHRSRRHARASENV